MAFNPTGAATFQQNFSNDALAEGWRIFGDTNLFFWNSTNQNLEVTWNSSRSNSYFYLPIGTILNRLDDFSIALDLRLDDIASGTTPGKPTALELAFGFQNSVDAQKTNFFRGNGRNSPNLAEFTYFPAAGAIQPTFWPAIWSTNSVLSYNGPGDFTIMTLPLGVVMQIAMTYTASNQTIATTIKTNGNLVATVHSVKLSTNFTDFQAGTFAIASYSDAGQSGNGQGSLLAHGVLDNIVLTVTPPPILDLHALCSNGVSQVEFVSRSNWVYTLERCADLQPWTDASALSAGNGTFLSIQDTNPLAPSALYRVRAERP